MIFINFFGFNTTLQRCLMNRIRSIGKSRRLFQNSYRNEQAIWDGKKQRYSEAAVPFGDEIVLFTLRDPFKIFSHLVIFLL